MTRDSDSDAGEGHLGFSYQVKKDGSVVVQHHGRLAATLRGHAAIDFIDEAEGGDDAAMQQLMARVTGNYKHGNERLASTHPRNRR